MKVHPEDSILFGPILFITDKWQGSLETCLETISICSCNHKIERLQCGLLWGRHNYYSILSSPKTLFRLYAYAVHWKNCQQQTDVPNPASSLEGGGQFANRDNLIEQCIHVHICTHKARSASKINKQDVTLCGKACSGIFVMQRNWTKALSKLRIHPSI